MHVTATTPTVVEPIRRPTVSLTPRGHLGLAIGRVDDLIADLDLEDVEIALDWLRDSSQRACARRRELLGA
jgi:hypothetical protein